MTCVQSGPAVDHQRNGEHRTMVQLDLCGVRLDHLQSDEVLERVRHQLANPAAAPLAIGSINLDHVHHFGSHRPRAPRPEQLGSELEWLMLIDGAPVVRRASVVTGLSWSRLAGADLLPDMLTVAERTGAKVGFLGGFAEAVPALRACISNGWPRLGPVTVWSPPRATIDDPLASRQLAAAIAREGIDLLVVGLGKPRQERWIETHGRYTDARVLAAFGAAADFLAGSARRAPRWMRQAGLEWAFRLAQEPRRLSRRYLVEGPLALLALRRAMPQLDIGAQAAFTASSPAVTDLAP